MLVDAGPDIRAQALAFGVRRVDAILFTHGHADHILGLDDIRRFNALQQRPMPCYGDAATLDDIRRTFFYVFDPATPRGGGLPQIELFRIAGPFCIGRQEIMPVPIFHGKRPILGLRIGAVRVSDRLQPDSRRVVAAARAASMCSCSMRSARRRTRRISRCQKRSRSRVRIAPRRTCFTHMCHNLRHADTCAKLPGRRSSSRMTGWWWKSEMLNAEHVEC